MNPLVDYLNINCMFPLCDVPFLPSSRSCVASALDTDKTTSHSPFFTITWTFSPGGWFGKILEMQSVGSSRLLRLDLIRSARVSAGLAVIGLESLGWKGSALRHVTSHHDSSMALTFHSSRRLQSIPFRILTACSFCISFFNSLTTQSCPMVTKKTVNSPSIRQLSRREWSWLGTEVTDIVVGAKSKVGIGGGDAFFVDVHRVLREVEEELGSFALWCQAQAPFGPNP